MKEHQQRFSALIQRHRLHIRDLKVKDLGLLCAAFEANLTGLVSLRLDSSEFKSLSYFKSEPNSMSSLVPENFDELIPKTAFDNSIYAGKYMDYTRAFWRLVLMNPGLRRLIFHRNWCSSGILDLMTNVSEATNPDGMVTRTLTPTSRSFLLNVLSRLRSLRHLQIGLRTDEFLLCNLNSYLPDLESFVHDEVVDFNPRTVRIDPHRNLRSLKFTCPISPGQLRTVVAAFPGLETLLVHRLRDNYNLGHYIESTSSTETLPAAPQWDDDLVHFSLTRLVIDNMGSASQKLSPTSSLLRSRTLYPHVTTMIGRIKIRHTLDLGRVLCILPSAATLHIQGINQSHQSHEEQGETGWQCLLFETCGRNHAAVKALDIGWVNFGPSVKMNTVYAMMPLLTRIRMKHCYIDGTTLTAFSRHFKNLEYLEFLLNEPCSKELLGLLVGCPKLKNCVGKGHVVMAEDIVNSPEWTCLDLERLDIVVSGVPRLTNQQEAVLDLMQEQGRTDEAQQTTAEEQEALHYRKESYSLQRKIYQRLGRHKRLRGFFLGTCVAYGHKKVDDCLELTLASGLDELAGLDMMEFISFTELNHRVGEAEDMWVKERWNFSRRPGGDIWHRKGFQL